jgi:hypothetical protein
MTTIEQFLASDPPKMREVIVAVREVVRGALLPYRQERLALTDRALYYGVGQDKDRQICYIRPLKSSVHLCFTDGARLPDPAHLLQGTDKKLRYIKFETVDQVNHLTLHTLLKAALQRQTLLEALTKLTSVTDDPQAMVEPAVYRVGKVTVDRTGVLRGVVPCPHCGEFVGMGVILIRHTDGRTVSFNPRVFHYADVSHPITPADLDVETLVAMMAEVPDSYQPPESTEEDQQEQEAIYLGVLTANKIKPLSRLEYPVQPDVMALLKRLGLSISTVVRTAENGKQVIHWILGTEHDLAAQYKTDFDNTPIQDGVASVIKSEASYFGYPACCAEAFIKDPSAPTDLAVDEQSLLFYRPCRRCLVTPRAIPLYRSAMKEAQRLYQELCLSRQNAGG